MSAEHYINAFVQKQRTYGYSTSRDFIITEAFRKIGALGDGETIDSTRLDIGAGILNPMVKALSAHGLNIWTLDKITIPLSYWRGSPSIVIGPTGDFIIPYKPLKLHEAVRIDGESVVPFILLSNKDYVNQTNKFGQGVPTMVYYQPFSTFGVLSLWQVPDSYWSEKTIECTFQRQFADFNSGTDEPDFPPEWHEALIYQLAIRLAPNYGLPPNDRTMLKQEAKEALAMALASDQDEPSLFIKASRRDW